MSVKFRFKIQSDCWKKLQKDLSGILFAAFSRPSQPSIPSGLANE